jgi:hypothetical protein
MIRFRVDDFPGTKVNEFWRHNLENFRLFHEVMVAGGAGDYVLGCIPRYTTPEDLAWLASSQVEVAIHGINHDERFPNEFLPHQTYAEIVGALEGVKRSWDILVGPVDTYIPPHNVIDLTTVKALHTTGFRRILTGPETDPRVENYAQALGLEVHRSQPPLEYGRSDELLSEGAVEYLRQVARQREVWLGLHWTWEWNIGLSSLSHFLTELKK